MVGLIAVIIGVFGLGWDPANSQIESEYFAETGHHVEGDFLLYYRAHPQPEVVYGYPITETFIDSEGLIVQYFQRARFEWHPENPPDQRVTLSALGELLYTPDAPVPFLPNPNQCQTFEPDGFDVCYAFREFYLANGGPAFFGLPISPLEQRQGRYVQYFQFARLQWHPEHGGSSLEVRPSELGRFYFDAVREDPHLLMAAQPLNAIPEILKLQSAAFPGQATASAGHGQSVFVIVQDQNRTPVAGVQASLQITLPSGEVLPVVLGITNAHGIVGRHFDLPDDAGLGFATVEVTAANADFSVDTRTTFRIIP
jgi:hypothetical protein